MFPSFIGILDIQSWWEVPSIAYFCSLFRTAFNLLDFDIEELEEALLTDGTEESATSLLTELIVRLLNGCLGNNDVSAFNYQMYLRRLFRGKCQESGRYNPFNTDIDFAFLPLRTKVEILYALCDFRLDGDDVFDLFKNLEAESLRVEPLGWDNNGSAYWYFYGTRLYREDITKKAKGKSKKKKNKETKSRGLLYGDDWLDDDVTDRVWQVVCFTEDDWNHLTEKFRKASSKVEKELYHSLSQNFLPEIPRLFQEKERLQRKRLLETAPRRTSSRVLQKIRQKEEDTKPSDSDSKGTEPSHKEKVIQDKDNREKRAKRRELIRSISESTASSDSEPESEAAMPQKVAKRQKGHDKRSKNSSSTHKGEPPPGTPVKAGRKTNNSLANETGQILIAENEEPINSTRKKLKTSQIFSQSEEDIQTDMYKILEQLIAHDDAWPFIDPVEEEYAPNYYAVIRRPMDLKKMEERLDTGYYTDFSMFKADFKLIVNNCRLYNGQDNEYTTMVDNLQVAFDRLLEKYVDRLSSSDEEIAVEYQIPTPSRKHKLKDSESSPSHRKKKRKSHSESGDEKEPDEQEVAAKESPEKPESRRKSKDGKIKKKRKGHHRHGKHSKNHKKNHKEGHVSKGSKHSKKQKHAKEKSEKKRHGKKKNKQSKDAVESQSVLKRSPSEESLESSNRSRSASPLPSIRTPTPTPTPPPTPPPLLEVTDVPDPDFYKDKYDKIKERRRAAAKDAWESLVDHKNKYGDKHKHKSPDKDKNPKLRETIEKLKAKNENYKETSAFGSIFAGKNKETKSKKEKEPKECDEESRQEVQEKTKSRKPKKVAAAKNESASQALEQAVKDISKWLDDAPKGSGVSSPSDSPAQTISTEEQDSRQDDEISLGERSVQSRKESSRKRPSSKEPKAVKKREHQRNIDRLQPGKSKGNLLTSSSAKTVEKDKESSPVEPKARDNVKTDDSSLKLSLGSVLPTVEFTIGQDHNFDDDNKDTDAKKPEVKEIQEESKVEPKDEPPENKTKPVIEEPEKKPEVTKLEKEPETEKPVEMSQEKATPNLSAWFKAFGTPKSSASSPAVKKKPEDTEPDEKAPESTSSENKAASPKVVSRYDSPLDPETPNPEGGDSPVPAATGGGRQRRTSTGSSVSERSSFSQDLDSPRHQMSLTSPLLRSPASPRTDEFQKITYPIINGTVRAGFYQDTTSVKSSPEKSCSPREGPQSPYSPYPQHVYASNQSVGSATPNYFVDQNKSPSMTYGQNQPLPYYDGSKGSTALASENYNQQFSGAYSPVGSPYGQSQPPTYSQPQQSPQLPARNTPEQTKTNQVTAESKPTSFPMKKRTYSEIESQVPAKKLAENKISEPDYQKMVQPLQTSPPENIAPLNISTDLTARKPREKLLENASHFDAANIIARKQSANLDLSKISGLGKGNNIDMVNMGYMNPENERRNSSEAHDDGHFAREASHKIHMQPKGYEIDAIAMNLGMNSQNLQKALAKSNVLAHSQERSQLDLSSSGLAHNTTQAHVHSHEYDPNNAAGLAANFSLGDIEMANKKLYGHPQSSNPLDYGNWKQNSQAKKQDTLSSDYMTSYNAHTMEKLKNEISAANSAALNYNKNIQQQQQYHNYSVSRASLQRSQDIQHTLQSELRIPNPRNLIKNDHQTSRSDHLAHSSPMTTADNMTKETESNVSKQKTDKHIQNHPLVGSLQYKTPYSSHSSIPIESLRNLPNIPQMLERYSTDERYLSNFAAGSASLYHDKAFQMAQMSQMFNKSLQSDAHTTSTSASVYSQASSAMSKESNLYKTSPNTQIAQTDSKAKAKRKRTTDKQQAIYHPATHPSDVLSSVKSNIVPGSAFNFGATPNMGIGSGIYPDNGSFSLEDFRNSTANQLMAANYMAAAVAHQRNSAENNSEKLAKPAHQNSTHGSTGSFSLMGQRGAGYPFVGSDPSSPLYQQYLQRHQEELLRQTGAQIMGLYPPGYGAALAARQPYDSINRPSWL